MLKLGKLVLALVMALMLSFSLLASGAFAQSAKTGVSHSSSNTHAAVVVSEPQAVNQPFQWGPGWGHRGFFGRGFFGRGFFGRGFFGRGFFGHRFFGHRFFGPRFFGHRFFGHRFFGPGFFGPGFFGPGFFSPGFFGGCGCNDWWW